MKALQNIFLFSTLLILPLISCKMPDNLLDDPNYKPKFTTPDQNNDNKSQTTDIEKNTTISPPAPPVLRQLPDVYYFKSIPIRGTATPNTDILISSSATGVEAGRVGSDGTFCVDLPLAQNSEQTIKARVHNGVFSDYTTTTIVQESDESEEEALPPNAPAFTIENISNGARVFSSPEPEEGNRQNVTDGDENSYLLLRESCFGGAAYVWIDLGEIYKIYQVTVLLDETEDEYPDEIIISLSTAKNINTEPTKNNWGEDAYAATMRNISDSNKKWIPAVDGVDREARFVGLEFNHSTNVFAQYIKIREIIVTTKIPPKDTSSSPADGLTTPTCGNGLEI